MSFFNKLNFTSANEDSLSEIAAIGMNRDKILCLTGSGSRPLDLLLADPKQIVALDLNPVQNYLLMLKIAAFQALDYDQMLGFLGLTNNQKAVDIYRNILRDTLSKAAQKYWDDNITLIARGLWYQGLWERVFHHLGRFHHILRRGKIDVLFNAQSLEEQAEIWSTQFNDWIWKSSIKLLGKRFIWTKIIGEAGGNFLPSAQEIEQQLSTAFQHASQSFFFRDSDFASLMLRGFHQMEQALPLHMYQENFLHIKNNVERIKIVNAGLDSLQEHNLDGFDGFSLSDFCSYCNQETYEHIWQCIIGAAASKAYFCERSFMHRLSHNSPDMKINEELSTELTKKDRAIIYRIHAGYISKAHY